MPNRSTLLRFIKLCALVKLMLITVILCALLASNLGKRRQQPRYDPSMTPMIIVITPSERKVTQLADLTRLSQVLTLVKNVCWIVVEDSRNAADPVEKLLNRTNICYRHLAIETAKEFPGKGWMQRNHALSYVRTNWRQLHLDENAIIYFADDDNTYDVELFNNYIRRVATVGVWAVGLVGGARVEAPSVNKDSEVVGWDVLYRTRREFAVDMAGFAVHLTLIIK